MPSPLFALENPFALVVHPQTEALRVYGRSWVQRVGLVQTAAELERFDAARYWQLIAGSFPQLPWEILTIAHDWNCWGFFLDDFNDTSAAAAQPETRARLFAQVLAILQDAPLPGTLPPFLWALQDVWQRVHRYSSSEWRRRLHNTLVDGFIANQWEAQNRVGQRIPTVAEYTNYRRKTGGWMTEVLLIDLALGRLLPEQVYNDLALQRPLDTANNIICWANDLFSFEKEHARGEIHNLVRVVQAEWQCSIDTAIQTSVSWHNQEVRRWLELVKQMPWWNWGLSDARHVQAYLRFCEHFMCANYIWSQASGRYHLNSTA